MNIVLEIIMLDIAFHSYQSYAEWKWKELCCLFLPEGFLFLWYKKKLWVFVKKWNQWLKTTAIMWPLGQAPRAPRSFVPPNPLQTLTMKMMGAMQSSLWTTRHLLGSHQSLINHTSGKLRVINDRFPSTVEVKGELRTGRRRTCTSPEVLLVSRRHQPLCPLNQLTPTQGRDRGHIRTRLPPLLAVLLLLLTWPWPWPSIQIDPREPAIDSFQSLWTGRVTPRRKEGAAKHLLRQTPLEFLTRVLSRQRSGTRRLTQFCVDRTATGQSAHVSISLHFYNR